MFVNWLVWFESRICLGWLKLPLGAILSQTTKETGIRLRVLKSENDLEKITWTVPS